MDVRPEVRARGFCVKAAHRTGRALYEAGLITYMRTDKPSLSAQAAGAAKQAVRDNFGDEYVRTGEAKVVKIQASQEAHEAIRPALVSSYASSSSEDSEHASGHFCPPIDLPESLQSRERSLYDLIYRRTLASAMAESVADFTTVMLGGRAVGEGPNTDNAAIDVTFKATGKITVFDGFLKAYEEVREDKGTRDDDQVHDGELPELKKGAEVSYGSAEPTMHKTMPPRRYTEATFVKELETRGVGRPSTYAHILETLRSRTYATMQRRSLCPSLTGLVVADVLKEHFPDFTDTQFTAQMEDELDEIAQGKKGKVDYLSDYYLGEEGLRARVSQKQETIDWAEAKRARVPGLESLDDRCAIFVGPYGGYLVDMQRSHPCQKDTSSKGDVREEQKELADGKDDQVEHVNRVTVPYAAQDDLELLTAELIDRCLDSSFKGGDVLGQHPDTGEDILIRMGPYGPYLQCGELKTAAIPYEGAAKCDFRKDSNDPTLPMSPSTAFEKDVTADSLPADGTVAPGHQAVPALNPCTNWSTSRWVDGAVGGGLAGNWTNALAEDELPETTWYSSVSLERAIGLLALPRVLCEHPRVGGEIKVGYGRFGAYVSHNDLFKSVPKGVDILDVDEKMAVELVDALIQASADKPSLELGLHNGESVLVKHGRFQKMVSCGKTKLPLPAKYKGQEGAGCEELTLEAAIALIDAKRDQEASQSSKERKHQSSSKARQARAPKRTSSKGAAARKGSKVGREKVSRPVTPFFKFCKDYREAAAVTDPSARLTSKFLAEKWKELPEGERIRYDEAWRAELAIWSEENRGGRGGSSKTVKRVNPYTLFFSDFAAEVKEKKRSGESLMQMAARAWRELDESKRAEYERRSEEAKRESRTEGTVGMDGAEQEAPKKPKNPYMMYLEERMSILKNEGLRPRDCMSQAAGEWRVMKEDKKKEYRRRYAQELERWTADRNAHDNGFTVAAAPVADGDAGWGGETVEAPGTSSVTSSRVRPSSRNIAAGRSAVELGPVGR